MARCQDLRQCHAVLSRSTYVTEPLLSAGDRRWGPREQTLDEGAAPTLLDLPDADGALGLAEVVDELRAQQEAVTRATHASRLRLLLAAESAGALIAAEMTHVGLPFDADEHDALLTDLLGPRPLPGAPAPRDGGAGRARSAPSSGAPTLNPDSPPDLLRALHARRHRGRHAPGSGSSTQVDHPAIEPLLEYKKLARLLSANGWAWMDAWVHDGRFRPDYVPGRGGDRPLGDHAAAARCSCPSRSAARCVADPGWKLVVADAAQLEPRVLAAMSRRRGDGGRRAGAATCTRRWSTTASSTPAPHAKVAMLGAMYGATTGEAGRLMPRLQRSYPAAIALVEAAARAGERGEVVTTWLGPELTARRRRRGRRRSAGPRSPRRGRRRAAPARTQAPRLGPVHPQLRRPGHGRRVGAVLDGRPPQRLAALGDVDGREARLVYFLHDEVIVEAPVELADAVADAVRASARRAGQLLFGSFPVEFALDVCCVARYSDAEL